MKGLINMGKILSNVIKKVSNSDISVKKNYKLFRVLQKVVNPTFGNKDHYEDLVFNFYDRDVMSRIFTPFDYCQKKKLIIFIHGGGWVTGSVDSYTNTCIELANATKRIVIAIDYRLAPEHPFPMGFNDCYDCVKLIMNNLSIIGINKNDVCLMGDSAGGNLVAAISLKAKDTKDFKVGAQILLYPALQSDYSNKTKYKSVIENGKDFLLTQRQLQDYISLYVGKSYNVNNPYISPLKYRFPFRQPKTLIITSNHDPLRDEGRCYAKKLKRYLNLVVYYNFEEAMHGFLSQPIGKKHKMEAYDKIVKFLGDING